MNRTKRHSRTKAAKQRRLVRKLEKQAQKAALPLLESNTSPKPEGNSHP
jgi:hypothetical protein